MSQAKVMGDKGANGPNAKLNKSGAVFDSVNTTFTHDMYPAHEIRSSTVSIPHLVAWKEEMHHYLRLNQAMMPHLFEINHVVS